ncbi:hypothetical protein M405DRAFT_33928, partial [Rhizopogon salebrosus TDB-379]
WDSQPGGYLTTPGPTRLLSTPALEKLVGALFMIMGTDVGHPAPGLKNQPSVASLIRSYNRFAARYEAMILIQHPCQEKSTSCANSFM